MDVAQRIRAARKNAGLTQAQLAEQSGVAAISIHQYEAGKRSPQLEQLLRLASALGVPLEDLTGLPAPTGSTGPDPALPDDVQRVASSMEQMNQEGREKVVDYAEDLEASGRYKKHGPDKLGKEA